MGQYIKKQVYSTLQLLSILWFRNTKVGGQENTRTKHCAVIGPQGGFEWQGSRAPSSRVSQHHIRPPWRSLLWTLFGFSVWSLSICSLEGTVPGPLYTQDLLHRFFSIIPRIRHYFPPQYMRKWNEKEVKSFASKCNIQDLRLHSMNQQPLE